MGVCENGIVSYGASSLASETLSDNLTFWILSHDGILSLSVYFGVRRIKLTLELEA